MPSRGEEGTGVEAVRRNSSPVAATAAALAAHAAYVQADRGRCIDSSATSSEMRAAWCCQKRGDGSGTSTRRAASNVSRSPATASAARPAGVEVRGAIRPERAVERVDLLVRR